MLDRVREIPGARLSAEEYLADFWPHFRAIDDVFWKLERIQSFREADEPSWTAMTEGDWARSLRLIEQKRLALRKHQRDTESFTRRRLRVVESPVTPYLQWEMHVLNVRSQTGERIRVVDAETIAHLETVRPLPELVILGSAVMYEVIYDSAGSHSGARRIDDQRVIAACGAELADLYAAGEDFRTYYEREILPLPAPHATV